MIGVTNIQCDWCLFKPYKHTLRTLSLCVCEPKAKAGTNISRLKKYICACVLILPGICFYTPYLLGTYVVIESSTAEHLVLQNLPTRHLFCSRKISRMRITTARHRDFGLIALGCQACRHRKEVLTATSCGGGIIYKYIAN